MGDFSIFRLHRLVTIAAAIVLKLGWTVEASRVSQHLPMHPCIHVLFRLLQSTKIYLIISNVRYKKQEKTK